MQWRIELLGGMRAVCDDECITQFRSRKTAALLAYLAFFRGPHPRDKLVELLWPESSLEAGRNSLRVAIADLSRRSTLPSPSGSALIPVLLQKDRGSVGLHREVTTDVADFEKAVADARRALSLGVRVQAYERALSLYGGALLPGFYEDWVPIEETRLESTFLHVLKALRGLCENSGDTTRAQELAQLAARFETQDKATQQKALTGKNCLSPHHALPIRKQANVGTTSALAPAPREIVAAPPATFTRFFGREDELRALSTLLAAGQTRLITITGGGGLGKTRLALEVARQVEQSISGETNQGVFKNVFWVPLADVPDANEVLEALAKAFNLTTKAASNTGRRPDLLETIVRFLRDNHPSSGHFLLVLDNVEQLLPQGSVWLGQLLERVPELVLLVTSRQRLNLNGEHEHRINALGLPPQTLVPPSRCPDGNIWNEEQLATLRASSSVQLFADRARSARSDWRLLPREAPSLTNLLYQLEGVPLAIELVASRAAVLSLEQMLSRLSQSLQWVSSRDQHRPARHRSLHAVLDWSLQLLPSQERDIFARLSVFHGGWTLEDAVAVFPDLEEDVILEALQSLRDASLITSDEIERGGLRFSMLEMMRQIAEERLEDSVRQQMRHHHARWYFQLAERASQGGGGVEGRILGTYEGYNFGAALDFWMSRDLECALEMAASLWWYWVFSYHLPEGKRRFRELLAYPQADQFPIAYARAQNCAAYIAFLYGDLDEVEPLLRGALSVWEQADGHNELPGTLNLLGALHIARGEAEEARKFYARSLELRRVQSSKRELLIAINALAGVERDCGHLEVARALCEEALHSGLKWSDRGAEAWALHTLGFIALDCGNLEDARNFQEQSLSLRRATRQRHGEAACLDALGEISARRGKVEEARTHYEQALEIWHSIHHSPKASATQKRLDAISGSVQLKTSDT